MSDQHVVHAYYKIEADYNCSYGKLSPFFEGLKQKKIMGTKCLSCGTVFCPPTSDCPKCWVPTEWIEVGPKGTLLHYTMIGVTPRESNSKREAPFALGLIKLDGASTGLMHYVDETDLKKLKSGLRVEAVFSAEAKGYITDIDCFKII